MPGLTSELNIFDGGITLFRLRDPSRLEGSFKKKEIMIILLEGGFYSFSPFL